MDGRLFLAVKSKETGCGIHTIIVCVTITRRQFKGTLFHPNFLCEAIFNGNMVVPFPRLWAFLAGHTNTYVVPGQELDGSRNVQIVNGSGEIAIEASREKGALKRALRWGMGKVWNVSCVLIHGVSPLPTIMKRHIS
jgi:hypothetical protein